MEIDKNIVRSQDFKCLRCNYETKAVTIVLEESMYYEPVQTLYECPNCRRRYMLIFFPEYINPIRFRK